MNFKDYTGKLIKIEEISKEVRLFSVELDNNIDFKAGQFINLTIKDNDEKITKPYSIISIPKKNNNIIQLCIRLRNNGKLTPTLFKKQEGDEVFIKGPFGVFNIDDINSQKEKLIFIGTGIGITPLKSMIDYLIKNQTTKQIILIFATRFEENILFQKEFEELEKNNPNFKYIKIISKPTDKWKGRYGHVQNNLDMVDVLNSTIFMCGIPPMVEGVKDKLIKKGMIETDIHFEKF